VPKAGEVESVAIAYNSEISDTENIQRCVALHQRIIQEKNLNHGSDATETYVKFEYTLKSGKTVRRWYSIDVDWDETDEPGTTAQLLDSVINSTEAVLSRYAIPDDTDVKYANIYGNDESTYGYYNIDITEQELRDMYKTAIYPDILDGNIGQCYSDYEGATFYECYINWASYENDDYNWHDLQVTASATRTLEYLKNMGITPMLSEG
jgi:hypothetical protein